MTTVAAESPILALQARHHWDHDHQHQCSDTWTHIVSGANAPFSASGLRSPETAQVDIGSLTNIEADLKKLSAVC